MGIIEALEALLFVSEAPASVNALARALDVAEGQVEQGLEILEARLEQQGGVQLVKLAGGYQLCTKPQFAHLISSYLQPQKQKLGKSLMEVLAIVAYRQPITMGEIDAVRGVQSDYSVHALVERRLIQEAGKKHAPGRPTLYATTQQFLHQFNMDTLAELPQLSADLPALEQAQPALEAGDVDDGAIL